MNSKTVQFKNDIQNCIDLKLFCRFDRERIDSNSLDGFPLMASIELCLISYIYDFMHDGFVVIRLKDLTSVRSSEIEKFHQELIKNQNLINEEYCFNAPLENVKTMYDVLETFVKSNQIISIECENKQEFYIGRVKKLNKSYIIFHNFDTKGVWDKEFDKINIGSITRISFNDRYSTVFSNYFQSNK